MTSCEGERTPMPRPYSYPKIDFVQSTYQKLEPKGCPFTFEYPDIALVQKDKENNCWFNLSMDEYGATIYLTYQPIKNENGLEQLVDDAFLMVSKHNKLANSREEERVVNPGGNSGVFFQIGGPVASPLQYYMTDEENHYLRASLHYDDTAATDSLQIVTDHIKIDMMHMIETLRFK